MEYKILDINDKVIAEFLYETDRDVAFTALVVYWGTNEGLYTKDEVE